MIEKYHPDERCADPGPEDQRVCKVELEFGIPSWITPEQQRKLHDLIVEITENPANTPKEGVHWLASMGAKPRWSQADAALLGVAPDPDAPEDGEPTFDDTILHFETHARGFVAERERAKVMQDRKEVACPTNSSSG